MNGISFIFCVNTYNRFLPQVLEGVLLHKKTTDELLLVINSSDSSRFPAVFLAHFKEVLFSQIPSCGESRRIGVQAASNDLITFIDDDTLLLPNWRGQAEKFLLIPSVAFFHAQGQTGYPTMLNFNIDEPFIFKIDTAGSVFRRSVILAAGNFDPLMTRFEDTDIATNITSLGWDAAVGEVCIQDLERTTLRIIAYRAVSNLNPEAKVFLKAGLKLNIQSAFQIPFLLLKMGHWPWMFSFYSLLIRFLIVFRNQSGNSISMYQKKKRKLKVLVSIDDAFYLLSDSVRIVFGETEIRLIGLKSTACFNLPVLDIEMNSNSKLFAINFHKLDAKTKLSMISSGFIRSV